MPKLSDRPLTRVCIRLYADNLAYIEKISGPDRQTNFIIRNVIDAYVRHLRAQEREVRDAEKPLEIEIDTSAFAEQVE